MNTIFTLGYSGSSPEAVSHILNLYDARLVDIRTNPRSRLVHWNGEALRRYLGNNRYMHVQSLGNANYKQADAPIQLINPALAATILRPVIEKMSIILMCGCKEAATCHRTPAAEYLAERFGADVVHIEGRMIDVKRIVPPKPEQLGSF